MYLPPALSSIACSITPRLSLSAAEATESSRPLNRPPPNPAIRPPVPLSPRCPRQQRNPRSAPLQRVQAQIRHKQVPPTGYPHLFRFDLELACAPRWRLRYILLLIMVRSFLAPKIKNKTAALSNTH